MDRDQLIHLESPNSSSALRWKIHAIGGIGQRIGSPKLFDGQSSSARGRAWGVVSES